MLEREGGSEERCMKLLLGSWRSCAGYEAYEYETGSDGSRRLVLRGFRGRLL